MRRRQFKLAISGPARSGKDEAALWLTSHTDLCYTGSTSQVIWPHAARRQGLSLEEAWERRHEHRELWRKIGDELRVDDPGHLARTVLRDGDICVGIRSRGEIETVVKEGLVDLVLWVDREVPHDPTLEYGMEMADLVVPNHWGVEDFHRRLAKLAKYWGLTFQLDSSVSGNWQLTAR